MHILGEYINRFKYNGNFIKDASSFSPARLPYVYEDSYGNISGLKFNDEELCALTYNGNVMYQQHIQEDRFNKKYGICCRNNCRYYDTNHEHILKENGYCAHCNEYFKGSKVITKFAFDEEMASNASSSTRYLTYLNAFSKKSGSNSSNILNNEIIHKDALKDIYCEEYSMAPGYCNGSKLGTDYMKYDEIEAGTGNLPYVHVYCTDNTVNGLMYRINAPSKGIYNLIIHHRIKDVQCRGARIIINENTVYERSYGLTHQFNSENHRSNSINNSLLQGLYTNPYELKVELQQGYNDITIKPISTIAKQQHFRDFYFSKIGEVCEHVISTSGDIRSCTKCGKVFSKTADELDAMGINLAPGVILPDTYYSTINFNYQDPNSENNGFCRVIANGNRLMSIKSINSGSYPMPVKGVIAKVSCNLGCVKSVVNGGYDHESRLFNVFIDGFETISVPIVTGTKQYSFVAPYGTFSITGSIKKQHAITGGFSTEPLNVENIPAAGLSNLKLNLETRTLETVDGQTISVILVVYVNEKAVKRVTLASSSTGTAPIVTVSSLQLNNVSFANESGVVETANITFNTDYSYGTTTITYYNNGEQLTTTLPKGGNHILTVDCDTEMIMVNNAVSSVYFQCSYGTQVWVSGPNPFSFTSPTTKGDYSIIFSDD